MKFRGSKSYYTAVLSLSAAVFILFFRYGVMEYTILKITNAKIKLAPGNDLWKVWADLPLPMYSKFYFFNVTNPSKVMEGGKPILKEMGPYVYEERRHKIILEANDDIVRYRPKTTYFFRPDLSHGSDEDKVTLLNVPFVAVAKIAWDVSKESFMLSTLDDVLASKGEKLFHTNKVREFLFDGFSIENYMELFSMPVEAFGVKTEIPERVLDGDFGFFDDRNGTALETWTIGTGVRNGEDFGKIYSFNGKSTMDAWSDPECDKIQGTDGSLFPPISSSDLSSVLNVFHPDACRTLQLSFVENGEFLELPTYRYSFAENLFGRLDDHPENKCFCKDTMSWCEKGGVFPLWPCVGGAPVFISRPHFMNSHSDYLEAVEGLNEKGDYSTVLEIDQNVGLPIRASVKLQMNLELQRFGSMATFLNVPNLMFPVFWMEEDIAVDADVAWPLRLLSTLLRIANEITAWSVVILLGVFLIAVYIENAKSKPNPFKECFGVQFK